MIGETIECLYKSCGEQSKLILTFLNDVRASNIREINESLAKNVVREQSLGLLEIQLNKYQKIFPMSAVKLISDPYILVPFNMEDCLEAFPNYLQMAKSEIDYFRHKLFIFFHLEDLHSKLAEKEAEWRKINLIKYSWVDFEIGAVIGEVAGKYELFNCFVKFSLSGSYTNFYLMIDGNKVYLGVPNVEDDAKLEIKHMFFLRNLEAYLVEGETSNLTLSLIDMNYNFCGIYLQFLSFAEANKVKVYLEEKRNEVSAIESAVCCDFFKAFM